MSTFRFVKSFSKGQITIPKEIREALGIVNEFWLKLSLENGKIIAEPVEQERNASAYAQKLLSIKGSWINPQEIAKNRKQIEKQILDRSL